MKGSNKGKGKGAFIGSFMSASSEALYHRESSRHAIHWLAARLAPRALARARQHGRAARQAQLRPHRKRLPRLPPLTHSSPNGQRRQSLQQRRPRMQSHMTRLASRLGRGIARGGRRRGFKRKSIGSLQKNASCLGVRVIGVTLPVTLCRQL